MGSYRQNGDSAMVIRKHLTDIFYLTGYEIFAVSLFNLPSAEQNSTAMDSIRLSFLIFLAVTLATTVFALVRTVWTDIANARKPRRTINERINEFVDFYMKGSRENNIFLILFLLFTPVIPVFFANYIGLASLAASAVLFGVDIFMLKLRKDIMREKFFNADLLPVENISLEDNSYEDLFLESKTHIFRNENLVIPFISAMVKRTGTIISDTFRIYKVSRSSLENRFGSRLFGRSSGEDDDFLIVPTGQFNRDNIKYSDLHGALIMTSLTDYLNIYLSTYSGIADLEPEAYKNCTVNESVVVTAGTRLKDFRFIGNDLYMSVLTVNHKMEDVYINCLLIFRNTLALKNDDRLFSSGDCCIYNFNLDTDEKKVYMVLVAQDLENDITVNYSYDDFEIYWDRKIPFEIK